MISASYWHVVDRVERVMYLPAGNVTQFAPTIFASTCVYIYITCMCVRMYMHIIYACIYGKCMLVCIYI